MTEATTTSLSSFPRFMDLALELRNQIWSNALPKKTVDGALYFYKVGCWRHQNLEPLGEDVYKSDDEFRYDLLDPVRVHTTLVSVNHEAREVAVSWARKQGFVVKETEGYPIFGRPFNPKSDILYIRPGDTNFFATEPFNWGDDLPASVTVQSPMRSFVENIAVSEDTWHNELRPGTYFMKNSIMGYPLKMLAIIVDAPSELQSIDDNSKMQEHWEVNCTLGGEYILDCDNQDFQFHGNEFAGKYELYIKLEWCSKWLLSIHHPKLATNFKLQPALVNKGKKIFW